MAIGHLQLTGEQDWHVLKFMGQVQSEPNFELAFADKQAYWVMAHGLYLSNGILVEFLLLV